MDGANLLLSREGTVMVGKSFRWFAIVVAWMLLGSPARAQSRPAAPPSDAAAHFERGTKLYGEGDYAAALVEFKRAYELEPAWQVLFNIGQAYFQLRDYADALTALQRFSAEGGDRIGKENRATLDTELPDLANRVARVTVESNVVGASVQIDDQLVGKTPLHEPVLVSIGTRKITAWVDGRAPVVRSIAIGTGETASVHLDFPIASSPAPALAGPPSTHAHASDAPSHWPAVAVFAAGALGLATGGTFGVLAMEDKSRLERACSSARACPASSQSDLSALSRDGLVSTVGFAAGAALIAAGATLWLLERPSASQGAASSRAPRGATWHVAPGYFAGTF
jgi:hypothetical protein